MIMKIIDLIFLILFGVIGLVLLFNIKISNEIALVICFIFFIHSDIVIRLRRIENKIKEIK